MVSSLIQWNILIIQQEILDVLALSLACEYAYWNCFAQKQKQPHNDEEI